METLARIVTRIDVVATAVIGLVLRGVTALLALLLRRGKHRAWRRRTAEPRQRSEAPHL